VLKPILPWSEEKLRKIPPFEFENWAVIALGGIKNKVQVGDMGIDGRIYPAHATPKGGKKAGEFDIMDVLYPIQVKQKDRAGRPDIDSFEAVMTREERTKGFFVSFDFSRDAMTEIDAFFRRSHALGTSPTGVYDVNLIMPFDICAKRQTTTVRRPGGAGADERPAQGS
jgi:hypothetical protein